MVLSFFTIFLTGVLSKEGKDQDLGNGHLDIANLPPPEILVKEIRKKWEPLLKLIFPSTFWGLS